ncbi:hypothetical protein [Lysinibacillus sp. NPDC059133]|uniref:hypothetical protein n=1 Tax=Lysinibacillus sp. NPDC059133 TaxID=3346737 RepID=UPI00368B906F
MKKANLITYPIITLLIFIGAELIGGPLSLYNSYLETYETITEPITFATDNPSLSLHSFNPEEYLDNSTNQVVTNTSEAIKYRRSLPLGISSLMSGFIALFYREKINHFLIKAFRFLA